MPQDRIEVGIEVEVEEGMGLTPWLLSPSTEMNSLRFLLPRPKPDRLPCPYGYISPVFPSRFLVLVSESRRPNILSKTGRRRAEDATRIMMPFSAVVQVCGYSLSVSIDSVPPKLAHLCVLTPSWAS